MTYVIQTAGGASGSPVFSGQGQVTEEEPCSQKGKRIRMEIGTSAACGGESGFDISTKSKVFCVKNAIFEN